MCMSVFWSGSSCRVLEVRAGPGRFTLALAAAGARVLVTDISPVRLRLNARYVAGAGAERAVESRALLDVCEVSRFGDGDFDAVVAFGGPLSYAFDRAGEALAGLLRVTRARGPVIASVMSAAGAYRHLLAVSWRSATCSGRIASDRIPATGDLRETQPPGSGQHLCRMFRSRQICALVEQAGGGCSRCRPATGFRPARGA
jgi:SAM-dependent methyltransferase